MTAVERSVSRWGRDFDPERLARLELAMWKAYLSLSEAPAGGARP